MKESKLLGYVQNTLYLATAISIIYLSCVFYRDSESIPMTIIAVLLVLAASKVAAFVCIKGNMKIGGYMRTARGK